MRFLRGAVAASAILAIAGSPASAWDIIPNLWPDTDQQLGRVQWAGASISPDLGYERFRVKGSAAAGFDEIGGFLVGGAVGIDRELHGVVLGLWGNAQFGFGRERGAGPATGYRLDVDGFGTLKARAGLPVGRWLVYGTGGIAFAQLEARGPNGETDGDATVGWVAGGGIEYAWNKGTFLRLEYTHVDLAARTLRVLPGGVDRVALDADIIDFSIVRKFNW